MVKLKEPNASGSSAVGSTYFYVKVLGIDSDANIAITVDRLGNQRKVSLSRMFGKNSDPPADGDEWIITRMFGDWMFAVYIDLPT